MTAPDDAKLLETLRHVSTLAAFNQWLGLEVHAARLGEVELRLAWRPELGQYNGYLHAAIIGGLLDTACGFAAASMVGARVLASQFSVRCLRPAVAEVFVVRGRVIKPGKQQVFAAAELASLAEPEKLLAVGDALLVPLGG